MQTIEQSSENLHKALFESKTKEDDIIQIVLNNEVERRMAIRKYYEAVFTEKTLIDDLKKKLGGNFRDLVCALFTHPVDYDCQQINRAVKGFSTEEETVYEIIFNRPFWMIGEIKERYNALYGKTLEAEMTKTFSGNIGRNLNIILETERSTNKKPDHAKCEKDAQTLYSTKEENWSASEEVFRNIFAKSSPHELVLTLRYYYKKTGVNFINALDKASSKTKTFLNCLIYFVVNPPEIFAERVNKAIKGVGTNTNLLERIIITRNELDIHYIRMYYQMKIKVEMEKDIADDTSGPYKKLLLALAQRTPTLV